MTTKGSWCRPQRGIALIVLRDHRSGEPGLKLTVETFAVPRCGFPEPVAQAARSISDGQE